MTAHEYGLGVRERTGFLPVMALESVIEPRHGVGGIAEWRGRQDTGREGQGLGHRAFLSSSVPGGG
jgi:hypothetical protein